MRELHISCGAPGQFWALRPRGSSSRRQSPRQSWGARIAAPCRPRASPQGGSARARACQVATFTQPGMHCCRMSCNDNLWIGIKQVRQTRRRLQNSATPTTAQPHLHAIMAVVQHAPASTKVCQGTTHDDEVSQQHGRQASRLGSNADSRGAALTLMTGEGARAHEIPGERVGLGVHVVVPCAADQLWRAQHLHCQPRCQRPSAHTQIAHKRHLGLTQVASSQIAPKHGDLGHQVHKSWGWPLLACILPCEAASNALNNWLTHVIMTTIQPITLLSPTAIKDANMGTRRSWVLDYMV